MTDSTQISFVDARRKVILFVALIQASLFFGGAITTYFVPSRAEFEWILLLALGFFSSGLSMAALRADREQQPDRQAKLGFWIILIAIVGYLQRAYFAYHGPLLDDPHISVFRPVVAFNTMVALCAFALTQPRRAIRLIWGVHLTLTAIVLAGLLKHENVSLQRDGFAPLLLWLLVLTPLFVLMLNAVPLFERTLDLARDELLAAREKAALAEKLNESENRFRVIVQGLQVGIWEYRRNDLKTPYWWSNRFLDLLGYEAGELDINRRSFLAMVHPEDKAAVLREVDKAGQAEETTNINARILTKDQGYRWFNLRTHWQRDRQGHLMRAGGAISDIHDRLQAEAELKAAQRELMQLAFQDSLTEVGNRRAFDERLEHEFARARRNGTPICLVLLDLDYFKAFNDLYGHPVGDDCLRIVAHEMQKEIRRPADFLGRIGGEEFGIILPETDRAGAKIIADSILSGIRNLGIPHRGSPLGFVSASIGIGFASGEALSASILFSEADQALYAAKGRGRNLVV